MNKIVLMLKGSGL